MSKRLSGFLKSYKAGLTLAINSKRFRDDIVKYEYEIIKEEGGFKCPKCYKNVYKFVSLDGLGSEYLFCFNCKKYFENGKEYQIEKEVK